MGEMHRTDAPQGEKEDMVQHQTSPEFETNVEFVPLQPERQRDPQPQTEVVHREREDVSREVPPPADEAGGAETRSDGAVWQPGADAVADPDIIWISMSLRVRSPTSKSSSTL